MRLSYALTAALLIPAIAPAQSARPGSTLGGPAPVAVSPFLPEATITEGFDVVTGTPPCVAGWTCTNASAPLGTTNWFQGNSGVFPAQGGAPTSYIGANFNNTSGGTGTISNWLISPVVQFGNGAELSFWTRTVTGASYPDRLEIRASTGGTATGGTATSTGDFSILLGTVNPGLAAGAGACAAPAGPPGAGGYPNNWCEIRLTNAQGIPTTGSGRIAFRYFVTGAGPTGTNSDYIGIDTFSFVEGVTVAPLAAPSMNIWGLGLLTLLLGGVGFVAVRRFS